MNLEGKYVVRYQGECMLTKKGPRGKSFAPQGDSAGTHLSVKNAHQVGFKGFRVRQHASPVRRDEEHLARKVHFVRAVPKANLVFLHSAKIVL